MAGGSPIVTPAIARLQAELGYDFDVLGGQLVDKTRADRIKPLAVDPSIGSERDMGAVPGAGEPNIGEPALLLERGGPVLF